MFPLLPRLVRIGVAGTVIAAAALAFSVYRAADLFVPYQTSTLASVATVPSGKSDADVFDAMAATALANSVNVLKVTADADRPTAARTIYSFVGVPDGPADYGTDYPSFAAEMSTLVVDGAGAGTPDARGIYAFAGDADRIESSVSDLASMGINLSLEHVDSAFIVNLALFDGALTALVLGIGLCLLLCFAFGAARQRYIEAVKTTHGYPAARIFFAQLTQTIAWFTACAFVTLIAMLPVLFVYNGLQQVPGFLLFTVPVLLVALALTVLLDVAVYCFTSMREVPEVINGHRPVALKGVVAGVTQIVATLVILGSASSLTSTLSSALLNEPSGQRWTNQSDLVAVRFGLDLEEKGLDATAEKFAPLIREMSSQGKVLVSSGSAAAAPTDGYDPDNGNRIVINNEYFQRQVALDADGNRIVPTALSPGELRLFIPESMSSARADIEAQYLHFADFNNSLPGAEPMDVTVSSRLLKSGQSLFNYSAVGSNSQLDPILVQVDTAGMFPDSFFTASASVGSVLFSDASALEALIIKHGLERTLTSVYSANQLASDQTASQWRTITLSTVALAALVGILFFSSAMLAAAYAEVTKTSRFNKHVHGYPFWRIHGAGFAVVVGAQSLLALVAGLAGMLSPEASPFAAMLLAVNTLVLTFAALTASRKTSTALLRT